MTPLLPRNSHLALGKAAREQQALEDDALALDFLKGTLPKKRQVKPWERKRP